MMLTLLLVVFTKNIEIFRFLKFLKVLWFLELFFVFYIL